MEGENPIDINQVTNPTAPQGVVVKPPRVSSITNIPRAPQSVVVDLLAGNYDQIIEGISRINWYEIWLWEIYV